MSKFRLLVKRGLKNRLKKKAFIISNIVMLVVLLVLFNLPAIIQSFSSGETEYKVLVYSEVTDIDILDDYLDLVPTGDYKITYEKQTSSVIYSEEEFMELGDYRGYIILEESSGVLLDAKITIYDNFDSANVSQFVIAVMQQAKAAVSGISSEVTIKYPNADQADYGVAMMVSVISCVPLFLLVMMAVQMIGVDIVDEKSSKAIEIIIASVPAKTHMMAKISSVALFVIIQTIILAVVGVIANLISGATLSAVTGGMDNATTASMLSGVLEGANVGLIVISILMFTMIGTITYLVIASFFASLAVTQEDYGQIQTPLMVFLMLGFYIALYAPAIGSDAYPFLRIASYIPLFSPFVVVGAYAQGIIAFYEVIISFVVSLGVAVGLTFLIAPIYKASILSYDNGRLLSRVKKAYSRSKTVQ